MSAESSAGDNAESSFGTDEQLIEIWARRLAGMATSGERCAIGKYDIKTDDDVFDLAVAIGELAGAAAGQPAADCGQRDRLRPVSDGEAMFGLQFFLEQITEGSGEHIDHERVGIDCADPGESAQIKQDPTEQRD